MIGAFLDRSSNGGNMLHNFVLRLRQNYGVYCVLGTFIFYLFLIILINLLLILRKYTCESNSDRLICRVSEVPEPLKTS
jgi:hypothetical protein